MYATQNLEAGTELCFDYRFPEEITETFNVPSKIDDPVGGRREGQKYDGSIMAKSGPKTPRKASFVGVEFNSQELLSMESRLDSKSDDNYEETDDGASDHSRNLNTNRVGVPMSDDDDDEVNALATRNSVHRNVAAIRTRKQQGKLLEQRKRWELRETQVPPAEANSRKRRVVCDDDE